MTSHIEFLITLLVDGRISMTGGGWGTQLWYGDGLFHVMAIGDIYVYRGDNALDAYDIFRRVEVWKPVHAIDRIDIRNKAFVQMLFLSLPYTYDLNKPYPKSEKAAAEDALVAYGEQRSKPSE